MSSEAELKITRLRSVKGNLDSVELWMLRERDTQHASPILPSYIIYFLTAFSAFNSDPVKHARDLILSLS